ncbi:terminal uridylyltransferase 4-like [Mizuhopecten yessoensis]|uniref:terminal uridylyltransferase 4-like n=1 Tax=Mizuhopecten yessoensis TaxID=6573 RepID=UPI000B459C16|nr:terminal uridylyltransferase 4-like [Mizuhopecten yessoensis]XP_021359552.1 terminal uridylyltransferase 4-like [Mizuhopecten yessoensis]XP_021359553.1 terminal uridylyltransferase 4-like [Mizuhopecten yessoensis]XP_021359554.1 terminal uridylyltransferase 4-like [Mizuhopecten yessoensis]XP_021359556.1 terminal uridylyltransferase 4-like [Mizuhopecten yessoensis]XP_021359557.1 terminal uridylyltransferase 4-like [Mizuhopecten yessoensis]
MADFNKLSTQEIELGIKSLLNFKKPDIDSASNIAIPPSSENPTQQIDGKGTESETPTEAATETSLDSPVDEKNQEDGSKKTRKRRSKVMDSNNQASESKVLSEVSFESLSDLKASLSNHELQSSVSYVSAGESEVRKILKAKRHTRKSQGDEDVTSDQKQERDGNMHEEDVENKPVEEAVKKFWDLPVKKEKKKKIKKKKAEALKAAQMKSEGDDHDTSESQPKPKEKKEAEKKSKSSASKDERTEPEVKKVVKLEATQAQSQAELLKRLEEDGIFPLKKKSTRFVQAKFFCRLCDYHMDTPADCDRHMKDSRHKRRIEISRIETCLERMPAVREDQVEAIDHLADDILLQHALQKEDQDYRVKVTVELEEFLRKTQPEVSVVLYGSSKTGIALKDCDVNMDLLVKGDTSQAKSLTKAFKDMKDSENYKEVRSDFAAKIPCIYFSDQTGSLSCQLTITGSQAPQTSTLLSIFADIDPRVRKLGIVFRYFAKICKIDRQDEGTLPAYSFSLLLVHYLQKCKPAVLPVLDLGLDDDENKSPTKRKRTPPPEEANFTRIKEEAGKWHTDNTKSVGALWLDMLRFYCLEFDNSQYVVSLRHEEFLTRSQKKWNTKRVAIEDPFSHKRNAARSVTNYEVFQYIWDCFRKSYFYFSLPTNYDKLTAKQKDVLEKTRLKVKAEEERLAKEAKLKEQKEKQMKANKKKSDEENKTAVDEAEEESGDNSDVVILGSSEEELEEEGSSRKAEDKEEKESSSSTCKQLDFSKPAQDSVKNDREESPERSDTDSKPDSHCSCDPSMADTGISGQMSQTEKVELVDSCDTCGSDNGQSYQKSPDIPSEAASEQLAKDSLVETLSELTLKGEKDKSARPPDTAVTEEDILAEKCKKLVLDGQNVCETKENSQETMANTKEELVDSKDESLNVNQEIESEDESDSREATVDSKEVESTPAVENNSQDSKTTLNNLEYGFEFLEKKFTDGKGPLIICSICEKEGHLKNSCPEEALPDLKPLPKMTKDFLRNLTNTIKKVPKDFGVKEEEYEEREDIRQELEEFIQELYPDAELHLFGSSHNGFGFKLSDLDLCVTFQGKPTSEGLDPVMLIEEITQKLKKHRGLYNVFPITTAKVPIVKFKHRRSQLEGDISFYNLLALYNTKMIQLYASLDPRVKCLGYAFKVFAKVCEIGDASRGSLSSYAYILLLIYYLQQCKPSVLPVLQELYPGKKPERVIDGWNTWYFDDAEKLPKIWKCKNQQSFGELWLGMFVFYTEEFCMKENVVCIRLSEPLTRFEKLWNGKCIAIEDPFDLSHNLGGGLSRKMNQYIMKTFIRGRELYGMPAEIPKSLSNPGDYFFDKSQLSQGAPPSDRCCRVCNKIGHIAKECPRVLQRKEREEKFKNFRSKDKKQQREDGHRNNSEEQGRYLDRNMSQGQYNQPKGPRRSKPDPNDPDIEQNWRSLGNSQQHPVSKSGQRYQQQQQQQQHQRHMVSQPRNIPMPFGNQRSTGPRQFNSGSPQGNYSGSPRSKVNLSDSYPPPRQTVSPMKQGHDPRPMSSPKQIGRPQYQEPYMSTSPHSKGMPGHPWMNQFMQNQPQQQRLSQQQQQQQQRHQGTPPNAYPNIPPGSSPRQVTMAANQGNMGPPNIGVSVPNDQYRQSSHPGNQGGGARGGTNQRQSYNKQYVNQQRRK